MAIIINTKYKAVHTALFRLGEALSFFTDLQEKRKARLIKEDDIAYTVARDSIIQRFEFSIELFWKYLRLYLEEHEKVELPANTPRAVIRAAAQGRLLSEKEAEELVAMINSRNLTSHIYKEDIAEQLARDIPQYYEQMNMFLEHLKL